MKEVLEMKYIGVYTMSNFGGLAIVSYDYASDTIYSGFDFGDGLKHARRTKVCYTAAGRAYIRRFNHRYYLDEIMKTEV